MRRLEQALDRLAERAEPLPIELLTERLEARLAGDPEPVVVARAGRRSAMQTIERPQQKQPRRRWTPAIAIAGGVLIAAAVIVPLVLLGRGDEGAAPVDEVTTTQAVTTTVATTTVETVPTAVEVGVRWMEETDPFVWAEMFAADARFKDEQGVYYGVWMQSGNTFAGEDFDGDGSTTLGDRMMWNVAFNDALEWELLSLDCVPAGGRVECTYAVSDAFSRAAGVEPGPVGLILSVENGLVAEWEYSEAANPDAAERAGNAWYAQLLDYQRWVSDLHPDRYPELFRTSCCEGDLIQLPDTIPVHEQLIAEWLEARR